MNNMNTKAKRRGKKKKKKEHDLDILIRIWHIRNKGKKKGTFRRRGISVRLSDGHGNLLGRLIIVIPVCCGIGGGGET